MFFRNNVIIVTNILDMIHVQLFKPNWALESQNLLCCHGRKLLYAHNSDAVLKMHNIPVTALVNYERRMGTQ